MHILGIFNAQQRREGPLETICELNIYNYIIIYTKTFSIKMKENVGTSKPKKHVNKVRS